MENNPKATDVYSKGWLVLGAVMIALAIYGAISVLTDLANLVL